MTKLGWCPSFWTFGQWTGQVQEALSPSVNVCSACFRRRILLDGPPSHKALVSFWGRPFSPLTSSSRQRRQKRENVVQTVDRSWNWNPEDLGLNAL